MPRGIKVKSLKPLTEKDWERIENLERNSRRSKRADANFRALRLLRDAGGGPVHADILFVNNARAVTDNSRINTALWAAGLPYRLYPTSKGKVWKISWSITKLPGQNLATISNEDLVEGFAQLARSARIKNPVRLAYKKELLRRLGK